MSNTFNYLITPKIQFFNPLTGAFLAGGKLYAYVAGTSTPTNTYPDLVNAGTQTNPNPNPVILDNTGSASVVLAGGTKLVLQDSLGNQIWAVDNLNLNTSNINIYDSNGNAVLLFSSTLNAVNQISMTNSAVSNPPVLSVSGLDTNIGLNINTKGTGTLAITAPSTTLSGSLTAAGSLTTGNILAAGNATIAGTLSTAGPMVCNAGLTITGSQNIIPPGAVTFFGSATPPTGWLACDGSAVSRATYSALFTAIGTTFGSGDGSTTFNLPASSRKTPVGSGGSGSATLGNAVGNTGGEETHLLITAEIPAHTHSYNSPTNATVASGAGAAGPTGTSSQTSGSTGGGTAHNNMQPSLVMLMIIKT